MFVNKQFSVVPCFDPQSQSPPSTADSDSHSSPGPSKPRATTFAAKYMGSLTIPEGTLVKGRSVHVVHNCIETLTECDALEGVEEIGFSKVSGVVCVQSFSMWAHTVIQERLYINYCLVGMKYGEHLSVCTWML